MRVSPLPLGLAVALLVTGCQTLGFHSVPAQGPHFELAIAGTAPASAVATPESQAPAGSVQLLVDLSTFVAGFAAPRRLLSQGADLAFVVVTVKGQDTLSSKLLSRAALSQGLSSLKFAVLPGGVDVLAEAFSDDNHSIGYVVEHAQVPAGALGPLKMAVETPSSSMGLPSASPTPRPSAETARWHDAPVTNDMSASSEQAAHSCLQLAEAGNGEVWALTAALGRAALSPERTSLEGRLVRLSSTGQVLAAVDGVPGKAIALDPRGTLWVADAHRSLRRYDAEGRLLGETPLNAMPVARGLAVDGLGQVWVASGRTLERYDASGRRLSTHVLSGVAGAVCLDPPTGGVWAVAGNQLVRFSAEGQLAVSSDPLTTEADMPLAALAAGADGSAWVGDSGARRVLAVAPTGELRHSHAVPGMPTALSIDAFGTVWATEQDASGALRQAVKLDADGVPTDIYRLDEPADALLATRDGRVWAAGKRLTLWRP